MRHADESKTLPISGLPRDLAPMAFSIHFDNIEAGWWKQDIRESGTSGGSTVATIPRNIGELLCLVHSEISEAHEGRVANLYDDKLCHRRMYEVELADVSIRVLDILGYYADQGFLIPYNFKIDNFLVVNDVDLIIQMHSATSASMEHFRKGRIEPGCGALLHLLAIVNFSAHYQMLDLAGAIDEKRAFNKVRPDHKPENRVLDGGKAF